MQRSEDALALWGDAASLHPIADGGLINATWFVDQPPRAVLQAVNPVFKPEINLDIAALTEHLAARGMVTPRVLPNLQGALWVLDEGGWFWRLLSYVPGTTIHKLHDADQAFEAGAMLGRFHTAVDGWDYVFKGPLRHAHDTRRHMRNLREALDDRAGHPLAGPASTTGRSILDGWSVWDGRLDLPTRVCHGDPKVSNVRFDAAECRAVCMIDLDTIGPMELACELGDAWRSWCNPATEDDLDAVHFDLALFEASARGYLDQAPPLSPDERANLVPGIERVCLELAARFCADSIRNTYFREDLERFVQPGAHNLQRARAMLRLAASARQQQDACSAIIGSG